MANGRRALIFLLIILSTWICIVLHKRAACLLNIDKDALIFQERKSWFSGCKHVYLDVGTNVGITIRKIYEPHLYPQASFRKYFEQYFGQPSTRKDGMCVVGFEPNPRFEKRLKALEERYNSCGFKTKIFTKTGASAFNKKNGATFWSDGYEAFNEVGGSIVGKNHNVNLGRGQVNMLRLSDLILNEMQNKMEGGNVVMKMDIEGSELEVLTDLLLTGALPKINLIFVEWHAKPNTTRGDDMKIVRSFIENTGSISKKYNLTSKIHILNTDDESYFTDNSPLPTC